VKSQLNVMLEIWSAASFDAADACASSYKEAVRDNERLRANLVSRGLSVLTLDLPTLDNLILTLLECGKVDFQGPFTARRSKSDERPAFMWGLWSRVCDAQGCLLSDADPNAIAGLRQLSCFFKKHEVQCSPIRVDNAVKEYYEIESKIIPPVLNWSADSLDTNIYVSFASSFHVPSLPLWGDEGMDSKCSGFLRRLDRVSRILVSELGYFDSMSEQSYETGTLKHGPGAVSNLAGKEYKYLFPSWSTKLEGLFPFDWCSGAPVGSVHHNCVEPPSELFGVPKTAKTPRLIAMEPVEHQWTQQKVKTWLDFAMSKSLIGQFFNPSDQTLSQSLVVQSSIDRSLSTIDLSSASDRVSCRHVEALLSSNKPLLEAAHATRTRMIVDGLTNREPMVLKKFASMGSALTFPIQSIFFLCIALASAGATTRKDILRLRGKVRVFGDDIIIPTYAYAECVQALTLLGLKVNSSKSFSDGYFRESCGADYWRGYDVTPVKPKHTFTGTLRDLQGLIDTSNNLYEKGWWKASAIVMDCLPPRFRKNIFHKKRDVPGIKSLSSEKHSKPKWDKNLHYYYVPHVVVSSDNRRVCQDSSLALREFLTRLYSELNPRETGTRRSIAARVASMRVGLTA